MLVTVIRTVVNSFKCIIVQTVQLGRFTPAHRNQNKQQVPEIPQKQYCTHRKIKAEIYLRNTRAARDHKGTEKNTRTGTNTRTQAQRRTHARARAFTPVGTQQLGPTYKSLRIGLLLLLDEHYTSAYRHKHAHRHKQAHRHTHERV